METSGWAPTEVALEAEMRFPWSGGQHPWLDGAIYTQTLLVGIESKRYEPFRGKSRSPISDAYFRDVWGDRMHRYGALLRDLRENRLTFKSLDAVQLIKHAYGLRTVVHRDSSSGYQRQPVLLYLFSEPEAWPDGQPVDSTQIAMHREEIQSFAERIAGDEVCFEAISWSDLLDLWENGPDLDLGAHAGRVRRTFKP